MLITYSGSGSGVRPESEVQQGYRELLARAVSSKTPGTVLETVFLDHQPLSEEQIRQAYSTAKVPLPPAVEVMMRRGKVKSANDANFFAGGEFNQFQQQRVDDAFQEIAMQVMSADAVDGPLRVTLVCGLGAEPYDFDREMFPFDQDHIDYCFAGKPNNIATLRGYKVNLSINSRWQPEGFPVAPERAEELVDELGGPRFAIAVQGTVIGKILNVDSGRPEFLFHFSPDGAFEVRAGPELSRRLHTYSPDTSE